MLAMAYFIWAGTEAIKCQAHQAVHEHSWKKKKSPADETVSKWYCTQHVKLQGQTTQISTVLD